MRKALLAIKVFIITAVLVLPVFATQEAYAQSKAGNDALQFLDSAAEKSGLTALSGPNAGENATFKLIGNIINVILGFVGILFFVQLFYAGIRWMTSAGNEEVVKEAKSTVKTAVIGIVVVFLSFLITNFVLNQISSMQTAQPVPAENGACVLEPDDPESECDNMTKKECDEYDGSSWIKNTTCDLLGL